jgi:hypothetical protein
MDRAQADDAMRASLSRDKTPVAASASARIAVMNGENAT